ncbi:hypothetical protein HRR77_007347 [Exophiala dermatitidis]|nr:hypothetical protein HRR77_007347 [Exophiala dermatitidis]KAJ4566571.1 hypothetical protein HRR82_008618 [Exophiala dermatitidis]
MNAARQLIARRMALTTGPRLTTPMARYASTAAAHSSKSMAPKDRQLMHGVFTAATAATIGGVTYAVSLLCLVLEMLPIDLTVSDNMSPPDLVLE